MDTSAESVLTRDEMESRRLMAAQDLQTGLSQSQIARKFGVSRTTASRWHRALSGKGIEALRKRRAPGRPSRLTPEQLAEVTRLYRGRPARRGVRNRPLDHHPVRACHRAAFRRALRPRPCGPDHASTGTACAHSPAPAAPRGGVRTGVFAPGGVTGPPVLGSDAAHRRCVVLSDSPVIVLKSGRFYERAGTSQRRTRASPECRSRRWTGAPGLLRLPPGILWHNPAPAGPF